MWTTVAVIFIAFGASLLTFFSGFGLGTILTPVFILWFPVEVAVAMTSVVHFTNNLFKLGLVFPNIDYKIGCKFGIPALIASIIGASILVYMPFDNILYTVGQSKDVTLLKVILAVFMIVFVTMESFTSLRNLTFDKDKLWIGGLVSGFLGGFIGMQGALRSMFLLKVGLMKEAYIATGIFIACIIDVSRIPLYFTSSTFALILSNKWLVILPVLSAITGAYLGNKWLQKTTYKSIQVIVSCLLVGLAICLLSGII
jgi:hypothetical protein